MDFQAGISVGLLVGDAHRDGGGVATDGVDGALDKGQFGDLAIEDEEDVDLVRAELAVKDDIREAIGGYQIFDGEQAILVGLPLRGEHGALFGATHDGRRCGGGRRGGGRAALLYADGLGGNGRDDVGRGGDDGRGDGSRGGCGGLGGRPGSPDGVPKGNPWIEKEDDGREDDRRSDDRRDDDERIPRCHFLASWRTCPSVMRWVFRY